MFHCNDQTSLKAYLFTCKHFVGITWRNFANCYHVISPQPMSALQCRQRHGSNACWLTTVAYQNHHFGNDLKPPHLVRCFPNVYQSRHDRSVCHRLQRKRPSRYQTKTKRAGNQSAQKQSWKTREIQCEYEPSFFLITGTRVSCIGPKRLPVNPYDNIVWVKSFSSLISLLEACG